MLVHYCGLIPLGGLPFCLRTFCWCARWVHQNHMKNTCKHKGPYENKGQHMKTHETIKHLEKPMNIYENLNKFMKLKSALMGVRLMGV